MPKAPDKRKRGRPRKFHVNDRVQWVEDGVAPDGSPVRYLREGLVVEYRRYQTTNYYYVITYDGGILTGRKKRFEANRLTLVNRNKYRDRVFHVPVNDGIVDRGCTCQCCAHTAIPRKFHRDYNNPDVDADAYDL